MKTKISNETRQRLESVFKKGVEMNKYRLDEYDKFLNDIVTYGMIIIEKIVTNQVDEDDLTDIDEVIILSRENMFSEN